LGGILDMSFAGRDSDSQPKLFVALAAFAVLIVIGCADFGVGLPGDDDDGGNNGGNDTVTVHFATQILPIFQANCAGNGCHSPCRANNGGGLCLVSHASLMAGGSVIPGNSENSLMTRYLDGREIPRMPYGRLPLNESLVQLIRAWIDEGALNN
jgi:hypothetical protein